MGPNELIGSSQAMVQLRRKIDQIAQTTLPILIRGETGTGKEVVARLVHSASRRTGDFIPVDCGALSAGVLESELFGHERGSFTGADRRRIGLVEAAAGGTFFLDEVGELPLEAQSRLLRLLEGGTYRPVGSNVEHKANVRVLAATWRDLNSLVETGSFRSDLLHRLGVVELYIPPLRARVQDIPELFSALVAQIAHQLQRPIPTISPEAAELLTTWGWPGNVRELKNAAQYSVALGHGDVIGPDDLPHFVRFGKRDPATVAPIRIDRPYHEARDEWLLAFQQRYVELLLDAHDGNVSAAARAAGLDRRSIQRIAARLRNRGR